MNPTTIRIEVASSKLRRVGNLTRRRMRIDGDALRNGSHTDGTLTVEITGLGSPVAGVPDTFEWSADRPAALVIVRSGVDGDEVAFHVGPARQGVGRGAMVGDGTGIRSVAFCYDAPLDPGRTAPRIPSPGRDRLTADAAGVDTRAGHSRDGGLQIAAIERGA